MARVLLLLASVLLLVGLVPHADDDEAHSAQIEAVDDCHCCPDGDAEEVDCCEVDLGACCATSVAAALQVATPPTDPVLALPETRAGVPPHLLRPRDNGPPPTPPPIG